MTKAKTANPEAALYLAAVRHELADVPWQRRDDLLATVNERLAELPGNAVPRLELGPSRDFARELRESAGLPPQHRTPFRLFRATRVRTKLVMILSVVVIAALVSALVARAHYQPLSAASIGGFSNARSITDDLVTDTDLYRYQPGTLIVSTIVLHNGGWTAVSVDGATVGGPPEGPLVLRELRATSNVYLTGTWARAPKVTHFTVQPGKTVYLFVVMRVITFPLGGPGGGETLNPPTLHVRVLGVHHRLAVYGADKIGLLVR